MIQNDFGAAPFWGAAPVFYSVSKKSQIYVVIPNQSQTGVGIPRLNVETTGLGAKMFENPGDCHGSVRTASQ